MKEDATFRLFVENIGHTAVETFVGNIGDVFYDPLTGDLRLSDGETPGGISITSGSSIIEQPNPGEEIPPGDPGDIVAVPNANGQYFLYVYDGTAWQETHLTNSQVLTSDESPFTAAPGQLRQITLPDGSTLTNQQDINVYFATTVHQLKEDFETKIEEIDGRLDVNEADISTLKDTVVDLNTADGTLSDRLDVLETDPVTKEYVDDQDKALSDRLDVLEGDPVTKKYVDNQDNALSGRLDVLEADPTTKKYVDDELAKLEAAVDSASGGLIFIDDFSAANPLPDPSTLDRGNFFICSSDVPYQDPFLSEVANEGDKAIVDDEQGYVLISEVDADTLYLSKTGDDTTTGTITAAGLKSNTLNSVGTTLNLGVSTSGTRISIDPSYTTLQGMVKVADLRPLNSASDGGSISVNANLSFNAGLKIRGNGVDQLVIGQSDVSYLGGITADKHIVTREYLESQAYELPVATNITLGGIKIGAEFDVNEKDELIVADGGLDEYLHKSKGGEITGVCKLQNQMRFEAGGGVFFDNNAFINVYQNRKVTFQTGGSNRLEIGQQGINFLQGKPITFKKSGGGDLLYVDTENSKVRYFGPVEDNKELVTKEYADSISFELPVADDSTLGGVKVGSNLDVTDDGTLSVKTDGGLDTLYIKKSGDTMTGTLTLDNDRAIDVKSGVVGRIKYGGNQRIGWGHSQVFLSGEVVIQDPGGTTETGGINMSGKKIYGLADPSGAQDAATKAYVDANAGGTLQKASSTVLGGVKIGSGISIATDGKISVSTNYASSSHNHDSRYVKGNFTITQTNGIFYIS